MGETEYQWEHQSLPFDEKMKDALEQQHHAAQFLALAGHHLIPQKPDDSNTNMEYFPNKKMLIGNPLPNGLKLALKLTDLQLFILDKLDNPIQSISLKGKTKKMVFNELLTSLQSHAVEVGNFTDSLHYEIPQHALNDGAVFSAEDKYLAENAIYRSNAKLVLSKIVSKLKNAEAVKIWPHHFDTGSFVSFAHNEKGELSQTIGLGLAIPDSMISEPYYYLSYWSADKLANVDSLPSPVTGKWLMPKWTGGVLPISDINSKCAEQEQEKTVSSFYDSGIEIITKLLKQD
ncbi:MAG: hypothetical protein GXO88_02115 [Chlorobi bacterium]|nr:hypothetical protein [Chlorobiota bacterium]